MRRFRKTSGWRIKVALFAIWEALIALYFLWETAQYRGITAVLAEWQFDTISRYYPTLTYCLIIFLLSLPGYLIFLTPGRARGRQPRAIAIRSARVFSRALAGTATGLAAASMVVVVAMLFLPSSHGTVQRYAVKRDGSALPRQGPIELVGAVAYDRVAAFDQELIVARHNARFAPVWPSGGANGTIQFFVQLPPIDSPNASRTATMSGALRQGGLPGEVIRLYRYAGYEIDQPYYVLFPDPSTMRWPYVSAAIQLMIAAAIAMTMLLLQRRRLRRLRRAPSESHG